ncbi:MAG TPA: hypothetical protein VFD27_02925, partial [Chthoniobacteraceae bacterium]|nr:hypothetical protein [Chthoniobacteraceae bacterium]
RRWLRELFNQRIELRGMVGMELSLLYDPRNLSLCIGNTNAWFTIGGGGEPQSWQPARQVESNASHLASRSATQQRQPSHSE